MTRLSVLKSGIVSSILLLPFLVAAQDLGNVTKFVDSLKKIVDSLLPLFVTIALLVFFWGLIQYIRNSTDPEKAKDGKSIMIYGIIALFVMVSVWGLVNVLGGTFNLGNNQGPSGALPQIPQ